MENSRSKLGKQYCPINIVLLCGKKHYGEGSGNSQSTGHLNSALLKKKKISSHCATQSSLIHLCGCLVKQAQGTGWGLKEVKCLSQLLSI